VPKLNMTIIWTPTFEWYVVRCESRNWHQKDMCLKEIRLCAQSALTILGSIMNMIWVGGGGGSRVETPIIDHFRDFTLDLEKYKAVQFPM
jgi:hypothetical protein